MTDTEVTMEPARFVDFVTRSKEKPGVTLRCSNLKLRRTLDTWRIEIHRKRDRGLPEIESIKWDLYSGLPLVRGG